MTPDVRALVSRFEGMAVRHPNTTAVTDGKRSLTYAELNARSNRLAHLLSTRGAAAGRPIAVAAERSIEAMVAVVAVLKTATGYLPLDAEYPAERLAFMLEDSGATTLLVSARLRERFADFKGATITLEELDAATDGLPEADPVAPLPADALGYVIYTSGSTGKPKGVALGRSALDNLIGWQLQQTSVLEGGRTLQFSPLSFDVSFQEIWATLSAGGTLVLIDEATRIDARRLLGFLREQRIDRLFLPFVALQALSDAAEHANDLPSSLKEVITAGEQLQITPAVARFFARLAPCALYNHYGPSETHVVTSYKLEGTPDLWPRLPPIGRAIDNVRTYVLGDDGQPVPEGLEGELYIGGVALADGYVGRPELTRERFLPDPFHGEPGARMYRTGDLVQLLPGGDLQFLGRRDGQVKVRGFRIELGEIEVALSRHPSVSQVAVIARQDGPQQGEKRLVAYVVPAQGQSRSITALRTHLAAELPDYMVPSIFVFLDALPRTPSGKVDRRALPAPTRDRPNLDQPYVEPRTPLEIKICALWSALLDVEPVGVRDDFFDLGGTSLIALRFAGQLAREGHDLPIVQLFERPTPAGLAAFIEQGAGSVDYLAEARDRGRRSGQPAEGGDEIAVVGLAGRFPGAPDIETLWRNLCEGREAVRFFRDEELDPRVPAELRRDSKYVAARGLLDDPDLFDAALFGIAPREAEVLDPQQRILLELAWHALEDAGCDPSRFDGRIGVWAGVMNNTYFAENVVRRPDVIETFGAFNVMTANEKDYVATRISHRLDLTGPSVSVHTACSTSLVAIHMAAQSLRGFECDLALAGGASVAVPSSAGYVYNEGGMLSADGHCRPFDAAATGTLFSDGAAVVALRRLSDARRDGDRVYAVLKGSAINNDGARKASFTAPSAEGQARAVAAALAAAGVPSDSIGYVEAHGTATPLGDPIEVAGLLRVFGPGKDKENGPTCGLGSIKSNFGHLTAAAGVTGFIKTVLAVSRGKLPPTLHFKAPNPAIDFGGRFYVVDALRDWPRGETPRRAGVSSMGVGGTNAHAVVEEPPAIDEGDDQRDPGRPVESLWLSARTDASLNALSASLADHLRRHPDANLADVAFTLGRRRTLARRRAVVGATAEEIAAALNAGHPSASTNSAINNVVTGAEPVIAFVFPGQGSQYPGMGKGIEESEPTFRAALAQCASILRGHLDVDLLALLDSGPQDEQAAARLRETRYAQPTLFAVEYALAQLFLSWGVRPAAMLGHSVGEFVAATIAGVFRLEDALALVAARGRLMQSMAPGSMLSVRAAPSAVAAHLVEGAEIAAINAPSLCVVAGPDSAVAAVMAGLEAASIPCKRLHTSHAFHTAMMDQAVPEFAEILRSVPLERPRIPLVSSATGRWMTDDEAIDPTYWARHMRVPVQFATALQTWFAGRSDVALELGPGGTLPSLVRQSLGDRPDRVAVISAMGSAREPAGERQALMRAVGALWTRGAPVDPRGFWMHQRRRQVDLPLYSFDRRRYWIDPPEYLPADRVIDERSAGPLAPPAVRQEEIEVPMQNDDARKLKISHKVRDVLEQASGLSLGDSDANLSFPELGVDSLVLTQAALTLKKTFAVEVTFRQLSGELGSIGAVVDYLLSRLPPEPAAALKTDPKAEPKTVTAGLVKPVAVRPALLGSDESPATAALALAPPLLAAPTDGAGATPWVRDLFAQQLAVIARQIEVLSGGRVIPEPAIAAAPAERDGGASSRPAPQAEAVAPPAPAVIAGPAAAAAEPPKPFGAQARIERTRRDIGIPQAKLDAFIQRYVARTPGSKAYTTAHRPHFADPRTVSGFRPALKEITYPIVVNRSKGARMWDVDGNEYIDLACGFGSSFFGHSADFINDALKAQLELGVEIGAQHPLAGEVARLIAEMTGMDRVALCNTGSEAVLGATRLARTVTGNSLIVMFNGAYHGIFDEVIVRGSPSGRSFPAASGIPPEAVANTLILDYGTEASLRVIRERAADLAAVLVEPVQSRRPDFQPKEFLTDLRAVTAQAGCALIFDEVITGFRISPGGAQEHFGIRADLATYGKIIGGGMPIGAIAGIPRFMDGLDGGMWQYGDDSIPEIGVTYFAGTFVRHPVALAAARAALIYLKEKGPALQRELNARTDRFVRELNEHFERVGAPVHIASFGSLFKMHVDEALPLGALFFHALRARGVHIWEGRPGFLTVAHDDAVVAQLTRAFKDAVAEAQQNEFFPSAPANRAALTESAAPAPGARLGKDPDGTPAWYVPDPERPGKYVRLGDA